MRSSNPFLPKSTSETPYSSNYKRMYSGFQEGRADYLHNIAVNRPNNSFSKRDTSTVQTVDTNPIFQNYNVHKTIVEGFSPLTGKSQEPIPNADNLIQAPPQQVGFHPNLSDNKFRQLNGGSVLNTKSVIELDVANMKPDPSVYGTQNYNFDEVSRTKAVVETDDLLGGYFPYGNQFVPEAIYENAPRVRPRTMKDRRVEGDMKVISGFRLGPDDKYIKSRQTNWDSVANYSVDTRKAVKDYDMYQRDDRHTISNMNRADPGPIRTRAINTYDIDRYTRFSNHHHTYKPIEHGKNISGPREDNREEVFYLSNPGKEINSLPSESKAEYLKQGRVNSIYYIGNVENLVKSSGANRGQWINGENKHVYSRDSLVPIKHNQPYRSHNFTSVNANKDTRERALIGGESYTRSTGNSLINRNGFLSNKDYTKEYNRFYTN